MSETHTVTTCHVPLANLQTDVLFSSLCGELLLMATVLGVFVLFVSFVVKDYLRQSAFSPLATCNTCKPASYFRREAVSHRS